MRLTFSMRYDLCPDLVFGIIECHKSSANKLVANQAVIGKLYEWLGQHFAPNHIRRSNGVEFISKAIDKCTHRNQVLLDVFPGI